MRGHTPIKFDTFKGLWRRGDPSSCPIDHFQNCENIDYDQQGVESRAIFAFIQNVGTQVVSNYIYRYAAVTLLIIGDSVGDLYKIDISTGLGVNVAVLIVANPTGTRYNFITIKERLYINQTAPGTTSYFGGLLYTYDGTTYRTAGSEFPDNIIFFGANSATAGLIDVGRHYYGVVYETNSGYLSNIAGLAGVGYVDSPGNKKVDFTGIPVSADPRVIARRIVATKVIAQPNTGTTINDFVTYFIPSGRIADNVTTAVTLDFTDSQLLDDASYLNDISNLQPASYILGDDGPSGIALTLYNNRLVMGGWRTHPLRLYVSRPGDYETFDLVDGVLDIDPANATTLASPSTAIGITELQEYRDALYVWTYSATLSLVDNGDVPSTWVPTIIDQSIGAVPGGVTTVYQTNSVSIDYLIIASKDGLFAFNGAYVKPEITWKIFDLWRELEFDQSTDTKMWKGRLFVVNDIYNNKIYVMCGYNGSDQTDIIIEGDYRQTSPVDENFYMNIKWSIWTFDESFIPTTLLVLNQLENTAVLLSELNLKKFYQLNGSSYIKEPSMPDSNFSTAYIRDDDDNVLHYGAFRIRFSNDTIVNDTVNITVYNNEDGRSITSPDIIITPGTGKDKEIVTNFLAQAGYVKLVANHFFIDRFWVYVKPTFKTLPSGN